MPRCFFLFSTQVRIKLSKIKPMKATQIPSVNPIPATRYTIEGLRSVPVGLHDAATMSGVNKFQRLTKIEFPLAFPHMMLGLNQTIVFALFMVIIGAFIGTEDLGQYILKALSDKKGAGIGFTLGICVAFIGLIFDNLIRTWVEKRKKHLGIN